MDLKINTDDDFSIAKAYWENESNMLSNKFLDQVISYWVYRIVEDDITSRWQKIRLTEAVDIYHYFTIDVIRKATNICKSMGGESVSVVLYPEGSVKCEGKVLLKAFHKR